MKILFILVFFTQNNIFLTFTNHQGNLIFWKSFGSCKIKGFKKLNNSLVKNFLFLSLNFLNSQTKFGVHLKFRGFNKVKKLFIRQFFNQLLSVKILSCEDIKINSYNGCKLKKKRRL